MVMNLLEERREKKAGNVVLRTGWAAEGDDIRNTGCCQDVEKLSCPSMCICPFLFFFSLFYCETYGESLKIFLEERNFSSLWLLCKRQTEAHSKSCGSA